MMQLNQLLVTISRLAVTLLATFVGSPTLAAMACSAPIAIVEIYTNGGVGSFGGPYTRDYVVLHNSTTVQQQLASYSLQYANSNGTTWTAFNLPPALMEPGAYYRVVGVAGTFGIPGPDGDYSLQNFNLGSFGGKLALAPRDYGLGTTVCPLGITIYDFIGYGTGASCSETAPAPSPSNSEALRRGDECIETNNNSTDFVLAAPSLRNAATPPVICNCSSPTIIGYTSSSVFTVGVAGNVLMLSSGSPPPVASASGLPAGLTFSTSGLAGTPAPGTDGAYLVSLTVSNGIGTGINLPFALAVNRPTCTLDMDGDALLSPTKEGLVLMRAMLGLTGPAVTAGTGISTPWPTLRATLNANCGTSFAP